jgi:hypothetical protein
VGRFFDALLVDEHNAGHNHCLGFCARVSKTSLDQQFIYPLACHRI